MIGLYHTIARRATRLWDTVRPKKINVLFPETSEYFLGSVGKQNFLF